MKLLHTLSKIREHYRNGTATTTAPAAAKVDMTNPNPQGKTLLGYVSL
jgi:hypothetical protein